MSSKKQYTLSISGDAKHQFFASEIRNQVLADEFCLQGYDFGHDEFDTNNNALYLLADGQCVGVTRVVSRRVAGFLPVEQYASIDDLFPEKNPAAYVAYCEFSRLAILPEFRGLGGSGLLINASIQYALDQRLFKAVYCSTTDKTRGFNLLARRKDFAFHTAQQSFVFAGAEHLVLQASVADLLCRYTGATHQ